LRQVGAALATGNRAFVAGVDIAGLPPPLAGWVATAPAGVATPCDVVLYSGPQPALLALLQRLAVQAGPIVPVFTAGPGYPLPGYPLDGLVQERSISTNTAAAGGNANLMTIG